MAKYSFQDYVTGIHQGDDKILGHIYKNVFPPIARTFRKKYRVKDDLLKDSFQEALKEILLNIRAGKVVDKGKDFEGYLYMVYRNQLLKAFPKDKLIPLPDDPVLPDKENPENQMVVSEAWERERQLVRLIRGHMEKLKDNCQEVIVLRVEKGKRMKEIEKLFGYQPGVGKQRVRRCMAHLRKALLNDKKYRGLIGGL